MYCPSSSTTRLALGPGSGVIKTRQLRLQQASQSEETFLAMK